MERLPDLKLVAVSRGGPVNIDMEAARARGIPWSIRPAAMPAPWPSSPSAPSWPRRG